MERNIVDENIMYKEYSGLKENHPESVLIYRYKRYAKDDFTQTLYKAFNDDARIVSETLGIPLLDVPYIKKEDGSSVCSAEFPWHMFDIYIRVLTRAGNRVAICENMVNLPKEKKCITELQ